MPAKTKPVKRGRPPLRPRQVRLLKRAAAGECPRASHAEYNELCTLDARLAGNLQMESAHGADTSGGYIITPLHTGRRTEAACHAVLKDYGVEVDIETTGTSPFTPAALVEATAHTAGYIRQGVRAALDADDVAAYEAAKLLLAGKQFRFVFTRRGNMPYDVRVEEVT